MVTGREGGRGARQSTHESSDHDDDEGKEKKTEEKIKYFTVYGVEGGGRGETTPF